MPDLFNAEKMRQFQLGFGKYLRDPQSETLPAGIPPRRAQVYESLLINNVSGFINACFPVCRKLLETAVWQNLCRAFFRDWRSQTPYFREIPGEFLQFLQQSEFLTQLPPWLLQLAHYEWAELNVDVCEDDADEKPIGLSVRGPVMNLAYQWPVHRISAEFQPEQPSETFLVVLRNSQHKVSFIEINAPTYVLIDQIQPQALSRETVVQRMSEVLQRPCDAAFAGHVHAMIDDLIRREVLVETKTQ